MAIGAMEMQAVLEIGPTASLTGMARRCLPDSQAAWLPSLRKGHDDWEVMLSSLAELYTLGAKVDWMGFDRDWPRRKVILPTYPFEKTRHWFDAPANHSYFRAAFKSPSRLRVGGVLA